MKTCFRDARPEITGITATFDYVENYSEGSSYGGSTLTAGQTVTITRYGTHTFSRLRVGDFFDKPFSDSGNFVEHSKLAKCGPSNFFDFCNTLDDADRVLTSGAFVLWATGCCPCDIHLDSIAYPVASGIETTLSGFGGSDGTTYATLQVALPFYYPKHCRFGFRKALAYTPPPSTPTHTITHAVTGNATTPAEQLITLSASGILDGSGQFHWVGPDGKTYKFTLSAEDGEPETQNHHAAIPTLDYVDLAFATAADRANFQITLEDGPSNSYGSFRIAFVGKFANQAVNLITYYAGSVPGFTISAHSSPASDYIQLPDGTQTDVARCASGDSWEIDMTATSTGYTRTGTITFDFVY